jgi:uncharacterized protein
MIAQPLVADFSVTIMGTSLGREIVAGIVVHRDVWAPGLFELRLNNRNMVGTPAILSDDERFVVGNPVEIKMGYVGKLAPVMAGEITGLDLESRSGEELLTVRGHDCGHRLLRGRKTRSFTQVKDSDIARQVAQEAGLSVRAEDTEVLLEYVLQHNQTDWELLQLRARDLGFEVLIDDKTLIFQRHKEKENGPRVLTLLREAQDLLELRLRLSTVGLVGKVVVQGWNPKDKEAITGTASARGQALMGSRGGLAEADKAFGAIVDRPVSSQAEADRIALGRLREMALAHVTGEGVAIGRADLQAGMVVRIDGFGKRFSGLYSVASVRHTYVPGPGYRTAFTVRRNAT